MHSAKFRIFDDMSCRQRRYFGQSAAGISCFVGTSDYHLTSPNVQHEIEQVANTVVPADDDLMNDTKWAAFNVHTIATGYNGGRTYCFRVDNASSSKASLDSCNTWVAHIKKQCELAIQRVAHNTFVQTSKVMSPPPQTSFSAFAEWQLFRQLRVQHLLTSHAWQRIFGLIIFMNFVINMVQSQTLPGDDTPFGRVFANLDITFTSVSHRSLPYVSLTLDIVPVDYSAHS